MKRFVLFVSAILFLVAPALRAGMIQDELGGPDWLKYGADLRVREVGFDNIITWNDDAKADEQHFFRVRSRVYAQADPLENLSAKIRFVNEWRYYMRHYSSTELKWDDDSYSHPLRHEIIMDNASVSLKNFFDLPLCLTAGRQDILFQYGEGFLLMDGTPKDGSRSFYVDGAILRLDSGPNRLDFLAFYNEESQPFGIDINDDYHQDDQPIALYGLYWTNTSDLLTDQKIEGYYLFKNGRERIWATLPENKIHVLGARFSGPVIDNLSYAAEATAQLGEYGDEDQRAYGGYLHATYKMPDCPMSTAFNLGAVYLSGDDPHTSAHEGWDPILGRWPKWSELYIYSLLAEPVAGSGNHIAYWTNMQIYRAKVSAKPIDKMSVSLVYQYLMANEANGSGAGKTRGQNPQVVVKYAFNDWLSAHLWGEYFIPGSYCSSDDPGFFARWELMAKF